MIKELSYVIAIVEYGSVSKAAESLYITQPALSRYIRDLEHRLGVQLFSRINNRLILTYAGEKYVATAKKIADQYASLQKELSDIDETLAGRLRLGCAALRSAYNMPAIVKTFINKYPNVNLQLFEYFSTTELETMLLNKEIDLAIVNQRNIAKLSYISFIEEELLLAVPSSHELAGRGILRPGLSYPWIDIRLLHNQPYVHLNDKQSIGMIAEEIFTENNIHPLIVMNVKGVESAFRMTEVGLGCTIIPQFISKISYTKDSLKLFSFGDPVTTWGMAIAYSKEISLSNIETEFINLALQMRTV